MNLLSAFSGLIGKPKQARERPPVDVPRRKVKEAKWQNLDPVSNYVDGAPQPEAFSDNTESYSAHVWVYSCLSTIATSLASIDFCAYQRKSDGGYEEMESHPLLDILKTPNPYMTWTNLKEFTFLNLDLTGNGYIAMEKNGSNKFTEAWPLPSAYVKPVSSKSKFVDHYLYEVNGVKIKYLYDEIIHFRYANPLDFRYGQGSITALKNSISSDLYADAWNRYFFKNFARPDSVLESENQLDKATVERVKAAWKSLHEGTKNRGKTAILEAGIKYKEINRSPKDLDFLALRKNAREEILGASGVPPSMVGILEYANYANLKEQTQIFWKHTIIPKAKSFADTLTLRAQQMTGVEAIIEPKTDGIEALRVDENVRAQTAKVYFDMGIPLNGIIRALDLPFEEIDGGDELRLPATIPTPQPPAEQKSKGLSIEKVTKVDRDTVWKRWDQRLTSKEEKLRMALRTFFKSQRKRVLRSLDENVKPLLAGTGIQKDINDTIKLIFDLEGENKLMAKSVKDITRGIFVDFAFQMGRSLNPNFDFTMNDPLAIAFAEQKVLKLVREANDYTLQQISETVVEAVRDAVADGLREADTIKELADRIDSVYQFADETRSIRIARTEAATAANAGNLEAMKQNGVLKHEWISSRDSTVRDTHAELDGQVVGIKEPFTTDTGAKLYFPGDPSAPPEEIINCRCTNNPVVDGGRQ